MKRKPTKDELVESIAEALAKGADALKELRALRAAVHEYLGYDSTAPLNVVSSVQKIMYPPELPPCLD